MARLVGLLAVEGLWKYYDQQPEQFLALEDLNFSVGSGEFLCLVGPSGCGKSTLLRIMAGLEKPSEGFVRFHDGSAIGARKSISMVFQSFALYPWRTVLENVSFGLELQDFDKRERENAAREFLDLVGLSGYENMYPSRLSGGMKQRVGLARALAVQPDIVLMDEPFSSLDEFTAETLRKDVQEIHQDSKKTFILVTHDLNEAIELADRIIILTRPPGRLKGVLEVDMQHPREPSDSEFVRVHREIYHLLREEFESIHVRERLRKIKEFSRLSDMERP